jgi:hypothetical protein
MSSCTVLFDEMDPFLKLVNHQEKFVLPIVLKNRFLTRILERRKCTIPIRKTNSLPIILEWNSKDIEEEATSPRSKRVWEIVIEARNLEVEKQEAKRRNSF